MDPLGRGLESLIPDRNPDDNKPSGFGVQNQQLPRNNAAGQAAQALDESFDLRGTEEYTPPSGPATTPPAEPPTQIPAPTPEPAEPELQPTPTIPIPMTSPAIPPPPMSSVADSPGEGQTVSARSYQDHFMPRRGDSIFWIELEKIEPNPFQPRREFDPSALQDLASSIREHGILQPVLVTKREIETSTGLEVRYQLIAGERRFRASKIAGLSQIPAIIRRGIPDDRIRLELAVIENVQREDLNAMERARAFKRLLDEFHLVQRDIAARIGKSREMVANTIRLLSLPSEIQEALEQGKITEGHARAVLMAGDDVGKQFELYNAIIIDRLNVRESENRARQIGGRILTPRKRGVQSQDPEMREWQSRLQERFGTKVQLQKMGEKGKIVVEFFSEEELRELLSKLIQEA